MSKYDIYAWGNGEEIAPFDVPSTILRHLIDQHSLNETFQIIPNSNIFDSHSGRLPILKASESVQIEGFIEIWNFILSHNPQIENDKAGLDSNPATTILHRAYMDELVRSLDVITLYNFFVVKKNYEEFTRGSFKSYLPWPTQYKPPLDFRHHAQELCLNEGIIDDDQIDLEYPLLESGMEDELQQLRKEEKNLRDTPVINDMQKLQIEKQLDIVSQKKFVIANMQCIKKLKVVIQNYEKMKATIKDDVFQTILLLSLKCNIGIELPENFIRSWLKRDYPELYEKVTEVDISAGNVPPTSKISLSAALSSYISQVI